ncbi:hypothetical protein TI39_contig315g00019 [Zymoseptoria brevis]|uniref:DUF6590 domain-containing protein n=1 Tax=Zymoseptoria brevis TaxID=1047168 RepID=A0A0F4GUJ4_9PEZI|nr:hypothetical protein TI39_contig315g00019 [Zymoseptoria brevis]
MSKSKRSRKPAPGASVSRPRWIGGFKAKLHGSKIEQVKPEEQEETGSSNDASGTIHVHNDDVQVPMSPPIAINGLAQSLSTLKLDVENGAQNGAQNEFPPDNALSTAQGDFIVKGPGKSAFTWGTKFCGFTIERGALKKTLKPGAIVKHFDLEENTDPNAFANGVDIFDGPKGSGLSFIRKMRHFIVTSVHEQHWTEVPIYTYNNKGLYGKAEDFKAEHVSIRSANFPKKDFNAQSEHPHLRIATWNGGGPQLKPTSVVHFTREKSSREQTVFQIKGYIDESSLIRLEDLCKNYRKWRGTGLAH